MFSFCFLFIFFLFFVLYLIPRCVFVDTLCFPLYSFFLAILASRCIFFFGLLRVLVPVQFAPMVDVVLEGGGCFAWLFGQVR